MSLDSSRIKSFTPFQTAKEYFSGILRYKKACNWKFVTGFTLVDPVSSTGCVSRSASRLTGSTRVNKAFTLVELLIVIAILAVLAAAVVIVLNPAELLAQARDSQRITDLKTLKDSIDIWVVDNPSVSMGSSQTVYISIPDTSVTCANITDLPTLPAGWAYRCVTEANLRNTDGTGWVPLNLSSVYGGSPIPYLPIDPQNDTSLSKYYAYIPGGSYVLTSLMESEKQAKQAAKDGGTDPGRFEVGSDLNLWATASGLVGYWPLDGTGSIANSQTTGLEDLSGNENNGTASNPNGTGMSFVPGQISTAVQFDGVDDYVFIPDDAVYNLSTEISVLLWIKGEEDLVVSGTIIGKWNPNSKREWRLVTAGVSPGRLVLQISKDGTSTTGTLIQYNLEFINDGIWHQIGFTFNNGDLIPYIDGRLSDIEYTSFNPEILAIFNSDADIALAAWDDNGMPGNLIDISIDDPRVYSRALSPSEIQSIYNAGK